MKIILHIISTFTWLLCITNADKVPSKEFRITVAGDVKVPVRIKVNGTTKVSEILAAAGGEDRASSHKRISIIRCNEPAGDDPTDLFTIRVINLVKGEDPTVSELKMKPDDQLYLNRFFRIK